MSTAPRFLGLGIALGLAAGLLVGVGLTQPGRAAATNPSAAPQTDASGVAAGASGAPIGASGLVAGAPGTVAAGTTGGTAIASGTATAQTGTAIAYPYWAGSPGLAPENTIVVTGLGQADMQADGSDRDVAQKAALAAALADAKAQANAIAAATGLSISGVFSVSASVSPVYGIMPMAGSASGSMPGQPVPPAPEPVYPQTLSVSVVVAYRVG